MEKKSENGRLLNELFYKPGGAGSYSSAQRLHYEAKKIKPSIKLREAKEFVKKQYVYSRHKRVKRTFPRRKVLALRIDNCWAVDLIQVDGLSSYNSNYNFILNCVCIFSRKMWSRAMKQKTQEETENALESIVQENKASPYRMWTDDGNEFLSLKKFYERHEIFRYSTHSPLKSVYVERANATLESLLYRMMTSANTARWLPFLEDATNAYNARVQASLFGKTPDFCHRKENEEWLRARFLEQYAKYKEQFKNQKPKFKIGEYVRYAKKKTVFSPRGYEPQTELEHGQIEDILLTSPRTYKLKGKKRSFYSQELVSITLPETESEKNYFIEKTRVVNSKLLRSGEKVGGQTQYLLKAKNDPDQSSWISEGEYQKLKEDGLLRELG